MKARTAAGFSAKNAAFRNGEGHCWVFKPDGFDLPEKLQAKCGKRRGYLLVSTNIPDEEDAALHPGEKGGCMWAVRDDWSIVFKHHDWKPVRDDDDHT